MTERRTRVTISAFPGAGMLPVYWANSLGAFADHGVDIVISSASSSIEQLDELVAGQVEILITAADNIFSPSAPSDVVVVGEWGIGEVGVYWWATDEPSEVEWGVDTPTSGFSMILRSILRNRWGIAEPRMRPIGGSQPRLATLLERRIGGTVLHPGFDREAVLAGCSRVGGHLDLDPEPMTVAFVARQSTLESNQAVCATLGAIREAGSAMHSAAGKDLVDCLELSGLSSRLARSTVAGLRSTTGIRMEFPARSAAMEGLVAIRRRHSPTWLPSRVVADYLSAC